MRRAPWLLIGATALTVGAIVAGGFAIMDIDEGPPPAVPGLPAQSEDVDETGHAGHGELAAPDDGSCSETYNATLLHWNPTTADQMVDLGCPWPYPPGVAEVVGGREDRSLDAPFEPRRYQELWDAIGAADFGVCAVARLTTPPTPGFVFGFDYPLQPVSCIDSEPSVTLTASEFTTRPLRDAAAHASDGPVRLILGRWVLRIQGDPASSRPLVEALTAIGAAAV